MIFKFYIFIHHPVSMMEEDGFHLDVEDYLSGLLQLASELVLIVTVDFLLFIYYIVLKSIVEIGGKQCDGRKLRSSSAHISFRLGVEWFVTAK